MDAQTSALSKPLAPEELLMLQDDLQWALREFGDSAIPNTLVHGDIGHGNIIASADGPVFLDWADTYIGHPFLCAEHLLADLARSNPIFSEKQDALRWHYARQWKDSVTTRQLEMVTCLAPAIAAFSYAVMAWEVNRYHPDPSQAWPLMRSMVRRTRNELEHAWEITQ
jgi:serine/threonine-protein kinase RIO1